MPKDTQPLSNVRRFYFTLPAITSPLVGYALMQHTTILGSSNDYNPHNYSMANTSIAYDATNDFSTMINKCLRGYTLVALFGFFSVLKGMIMYDNDPTHLDRPYEGMRIRSKLMFNFYIDHFHNIYGLSINDIRGVIFLSSIQTIVYSSLTSYTHHDSLQQAADIALTCVVGNMITSTAFDVTSSALTWAFSKARKESFVSASSEELHEENAHTSKEKQRCLA